MRRPEHRAAQRLIERQRDERRAQQPDRCGWDDDAVAAQSTRSSCSTSTTDARCQPRVTATSRWPRPPGEWCDGGHDAGSSRADAGRVARRYVDAGRGNLDARSRRAAARPRPQAARGQLLRPRLPAHVEDAAQRPRGRRPRPAEPRRFTAPHGRRGGARRGRYQPLTQVAIAVSAQLLADGAISAARIVTVDRSGTIETSVKSGSSRSRRSPRSATRC